MPDPDRTPEQPRFDEAIEGLIMLRGFLQQHRRQHRKLASWAGVLSSDVRIERGDQLDQLPKLYSELILDPAVGPGARAWLKLMRDELHELERLSQPSLNLLRFPDWVEELAERALDWRQEVHLLFRLIDDCTDPALAGAIALLREIQFRFEMERPGSQPLPELNDSDSAVAEIIWHHGPITSKEIAAKDDCPVAAGSVRSRIVPKLRPYGLATSSSSGYRFHPNAKIRGYIN